MGEQVVPDKTEIFAPKAFNTILYCRQWERTVAFYRDKLRLSITFANDWFVEFKVTGNGYLSIANVERTSLNRNYKGDNSGLTLTFQVDDADQTWLMLRESGLTLGPVKTHPWGARLFYFHDPEGHRLEIWSLLKDTQ